MKWLKTVSWISTKGLFWMSGRRVQTARRREGKLRRIIGSPIPVDLLTGKG